STSPSKLLSRKSIPFLIEAVTSSSVSPAAFGTIRSSGGGGLGGAATTGADVGGLTGEGFTSNSGCFAGAVATGIGGGGTVATGGDGRCTNSSIVTITMIHSAANPPAIHRIQLTSRFSAER